MRDAKVQESRVKEWRLVYSSFINEIGTFPACSFKKNQE
jgi:hypothetical protein